jgi:hypothetical protein
MKPSLFLVSIIILTLSSNFKAQDNSAFEKGTVVATVGYGFPDFYRTSVRTAYGSPYTSKKITGFGPLIVKGDYGIVKFKWGHSVGAGIVLGYSSTKATYSYYHYDYSIPRTLITGTDVYSTITIGARGTYHFFTKEKIDCYASVGLGFNINSYSESTSGYNTNATGYVMRAPLASAFTVGIRYYFTKNIGVYAEVGWDMSVPMQGGLAIKF